jgi:hypothetical protein
VPASILTDAQLDVNKKKIKLPRTQCCRQPAAKSPHIKSPTAAGMRQHKRSQQLKKEKSEVKFSIEKRTSRKRKEHRNKL